MAFEFDPRTKIFLLLLSPVIMGLEVNLTTEILVTVIYLAPFFLTKEIKWGLALSGIYIFQLITAFLIIPHVTSIFLLYILSLLSNGLRRMMPSVISGAYAVKTIHISEWISTFKKWKFPNAVTIPLAVIVRFFPTVRQDYRHIRRAMAFRGIGSGFWDFVKNPIQTFEFILIPLLMNASQVAQDLTISALTKGLGMPGKHTSVIELNMTIYDWAYIFIAVTPVILYLGGLL